MKLLTEYTKNDHTFAVVERIQDTAIFHGRSTKGSSETWEVIQIQKQEAGNRTFGGVVVNVEAREFPPSNNQWGSKGWTCVNLEDAKKRLTLLVETVNKSPEQK